MQSFMIQQLLNALLAVLTDDVMKKVVDSLLDAVEDAVEDSANTLDDAIVLPLCRRIRQVFDVPDND